MSKNNVVPTELPDVSTWVKLQEALPLVEDEAVAEAMLEHEKNGPKRIQWLLRLHAKFNGLRTARERKEILKIAGAD